MVATDGCQVLVQGGYGLPWDDDLLVRAVPLFACRAAARRPVAIGRATSHVVLRTGPWTLHLSIEADARFPRVEHAVPDPASASTRATPRSWPGLSTASAAATSRTRLRRSPGTAASPCAPARPPTELVPSSSHYSGEPVRLHTNREYLARALRLGFDEVRLFGPDAPALCRDGLRSFACQPLSKDSAMGPTEDAVIVEPAVAGPPVETIEMERPSPPGGLVPKPAPVPAPGGRAGGVASALEEEEEALHRALAEARSRTGRLVAALRHDQRRSRLVASTLRSIEELRPQDVAGG